MGASNKIGNVFRATLSTFEAPSCTARIVRRMRKGRERAWAWTDFWSVGNVETAECVDERYEKCVRVSAVRCGSYLGIYAKVWNTNCKFMHWGREYTYRGGRAFSWSMISQIGCFCVNATFVGSFSCHNKMVFHTNFYSFLSLECTLREATIRRSGIDLGVLNLISWLV